jgi:hypothetical protein
MSVDATCVFAQIAVAAVLLASNRVRFYVVALLCLLPFHTGLDTCGDAGGRDRAHNGFMSFVKVGVLLLFPCYE